LIDIRQFMTASTKKRTLSLLSIQYHPQQVLRGSLIQDMLVVTAILVVLMPSLLAALRRLEMRVPIESWINIWLPSLNLNLALTC
jgi:hypothetical protein